MDAYQMNRVAIEVAKQKNNLITNKDYVMAPQLGYYSKEEFHETVQEWVAEGGYVIVKFKHGLNTYYSQLKNMPSSIDTYELVKAKQTYEAMFHYANDYVYGMAMQHA